jgi:hypothetical protein
VRRRTRGLLGTDASRRGLRPRPGARRLEGEFIDEVRAYVREFKTYYDRCTDCETPYPPWVLEFDHVDPTTKCFNVGDASSVPSMDALLDEIEKCDVVCSNCHKDREHWRKKQRLRPCLLTVGNLILTQETVGSTPPRVKGYTLPRMATER